MEAVMITKKVVEMAAMVANALPPHLLQVRVWPEPVEA
jgi:hypothetical protein